MESGAIIKKYEKIGQEQFNSFVFSNELSWQDIIHDLISTEQLDPWDIDLGIIANKYLERIKELEETNFTLSSKVLLVCALLLRIKSELLMNRYIKNLDDVLFNNKEEIDEKIKFEDFDDEEIPALMPRTPLPRFKKISLQELIQSLSKAINTETRREVKKRIEREAYERTRFFIPKKTINIVEKIREIHSKVIELFKVHEKIKFSEFSGEKKEEKIDTFIPLLHLDNQNKLWLQQEKHFDEIWIHKDGAEFITKDEIITNSIENEFEEEFAEQAEEFNAEEKSAQ